MRHLILNIGLGHEHPIDTAAWALDLLPALGRIENAMLLLDAKDEPVFVVYVESDLDDPVPALTRIAVHLQQEAIAVWDATEARGYMAGPKREAWEPFDPEKFLTWERYAASFHSAPQAN